MKQRIKQCILALLLVLTLVGCAEQTKDPKTVDVQPLVIEQPKRCREGTLEVFAEGVEKFEYKGTIYIINDGRDGENVKIVIDATEGKTDN